MVATELRPLSLGELLDRAFSLYRNNFWLFVGIMAIPSAFSVPFTVIWLSMRRPAAFGARPSPASAAGAGLFGLTFLVLFWAVYAMAIGAATYAVSETYLGQSPTVRGSYRKVRGKFWWIMRVVGAIWLRLVGVLLVVFIGVAIVVGIVAVSAGAIARGQPRTVGIVVGVVIFLAYVAGMGLWIFFSLRYAVSIPALLLENLGVSAAIRRSVQLTARSPLADCLSRSCWVWSSHMLGVIVFQGPFFVTMLFAAARAGHMPRLADLHLRSERRDRRSDHWTVLMIVLVLCYYDARIRKEAFDLQFMMSSLDGPVAARRDRFSSLRPCFLATLFATPPHRAPVCSLLIAEVFPCPLWTQPAASAAAESTAQLAGVYRGTPNGR